MSSSSAVPPGILAVPACREHWTLRRVRRAADEPSHGIHRDGAVVAYRRNARTQVITSGWSESSILRCDDRRLLWRLEVADAVAGGSLWNTARAHVVRGGGHAACYEQLVRSSTAVAKGRRTGWGHELMSV